ncbi:MULTISPECIES: hypothetical protein [unclassified Lacinutrix]
MKKILGLALLLCTGMSFSQTSSATIIGGGGGNKISDLFANDNMNTNSGFWITTTTSGDMNGSSYLYENWINRGEIYDATGKGYNIPNCNFNISSNRIEALLNEDSAEKVFVFNTRDLKKVRIGLKTFVNKNIDKGQNYLLEVIQEGDKIALYKSHSTLVIVAEVNPMTNQKMGKDKMTVENSYYAEKNGKIQEVKMKKSNLLKLMSNKKREVNSFIKENKISTSKEADLFKIFQYYNTL